MAFVDQLPVSPVIRSPIPFPDTAVSKRVVLERPAPPPVRKTCPTCGAVFDDYTKRWNTLYCRSTCRVKMSELKANEAVKTLAMVMSIPLDMADDIYTMRRLPHVESVLNEHGYRWDMEKKAWSK